MGVEFCRQAGWPAGGVGGDPGSRDMGLQEGPGRTPLSGDSSGLGFTWSFVTLHTARARVPSSQGRCPERLQLRHALGVSVPLSSVGTALLAMGTLPCPPHAVLVSLPVSANTPLHQHSRVGGHTRTQSKGQTKPLAGKQMTTRDLVHE